MMRTILIGLAFGLVVAIVVYVATGGHVIFLPLIFVPLVLLFGGGRRPD